MSPSSSHPPAPAVSVIIPTYNQPALLLEALDSVFAQTVKDLEVIVVDDGSTPETAEAVQPLRGRVRFQRKENGGPASARNAGFLLSRGRYVAFLDHDDVWLPDKLERHLALHEREPRFGATYSRCLVVEEPAGEEATANAAPARKETAKKAVAKAPRRVPEKGYSGQVFERLVRKSLIQTYSSVVVRRECLVALEKARSAPRGGKGPLDETYKVADDYDLWFRLARRYELGFIEEPLVRYRVHTGNVTKDNLALHEEKVKIFLSLLYGSDALEARAEKAVRLKLARHLVAVGKHHYRAGDYARAGKFFNEAVKADPAYFKGRRYQFLNFVKGILARV